MEKSRVITQVAGERNFHIFYQLLAGANEDELQRLYLRPNLGAYYYLSGGVSTYIYNYDIFILGHRKLRQQLNTFTHWRSKLRRRSN